MCTWIHTHCDYFISSLLSFSSREPASSACVSAARLPSAQRPAAYRYISSSHRALHISGLDSVIYSNSDMMDKVWNNVHASLSLSLCLRLPWQEQRRVSPAGGGRAGRSEAHPTGACGRRTFTGGWRSCEPGQTTRGCGTWLAPSGLTSPSATGWATIVPSLTLNLRSEDKERQGADLRVWGWVEGSFNMCLHFHSTGP